MVKSLVEFNLKYKSIVFKKTVKNITYLHTRNIFIFLIQFCPCIICFLSSAHVITHNLIHLQLAESISWYVKISKFKS